MRGSRKFCQRGSNFDKVFLVDKEREDPNTTFSWPSSARKRNAILMAFLCRASDGPTLNAGLVALWFFWGSEPVMPRNPIIFDFSGEGGGGGGGGGSRLHDPPPPSLDLHMHFNIYFKVLQDHVVLSVTKTNQLIKIFTC